jgi:hypothetical protein
MNHTMLWLGAVIASPPPDSDQRRDEADAIRRAHGHDGERWTAGRWSEHRDINEVMPATSLIPDGFLILY